MKIRGLSEETRCSELIKDEVEAKLEILKLSIRESLKEFNYSETLTSCMSYCLNESDIS